MNIKKIRFFLALAITTSLSPFSGLSVNLPGQSIQLTPAAQAATCDNNIRYVNFSGRVGPNAVNIRTSRSLSAPVIRTIAANTSLSFDAWAYGDSVRDIWTGNSDARWYKLRGQNAWVASAVIWGNPPNAPLQPNCSTPTGSFYQNPEAFYNWAIGKVGIARLDTSDLKGQCVSLVARYIQEVKFPSNMRTQRYAYGHGKDTASVVANNSPFSQYFSGYTKSGLPSRGAVISFPGPDTRYGHTGIVMESRYSNGQRQVRILESNWDSRAESSTVRIGGWINIDSTRNGYGGTNGWTNPR